MALGQQELLEVPAPRHVVIPRAQVAVAAWWGVDAATGRLNLGWVSPDEGPEPGPDATWWRAEGWRRGVQSVKLGAVNENEGQRLLIIREQVHALVKAMREAGVPLPGVIFVEHPAGQHPKPQLYYAVGCAASALYEAVRQIGGYVPRVEFCVSGHWKLVACGSGRINKPKWGKHGGGRSWDEVRETYGVLQWARLNGYTGDSRDCWDDADSLAMGECARRDVGIRLAG